MQHFYFYIYSLWEYWEIRPSSNSDKFDAVFVASPFKKTGKQQKGVWQGLRKGFSVGSMKPLGLVQTFSTDLQVRIPGCFLKNFMHLIDAMKKSSDSLYQTFILYIFAYTGIQLRQNVSLFCRVVNVNSQDLVSLRNSCLNFFRAKSIFSTVTPTTWTFGHIIPAHA